MCLVLECVVLLGWVGDGSEESGFLSAFGRVSLPWKGGFSSGFSVANLLRVQW